MEPAGEHRPALPIEGAFVMQLDAIAIITQDRLSRRVEHMISAQATHFHSGAELLAFMKRVLIERPAASPEAL